MTRIILHSIVPFQIADHLTRVASANENRLKDAGILRGLMGRVLSTGDHEIVSSFEIADDSSLNRIDVRERADMYTAVFGADVIFVGFYRVNIYPSLENELLKIFQGFEDYILLQSHLTDPLTIDAQISHASCFEKVELTLQVSPSDSTCFVSDHLSGYGSSGPRVSETINTHNTTVDILAERLLSFGSLLFQDDRSANLRDVYRRAYFLSCYQIHSCCEPATDTDVLALTETAVLARVCSMSDDVVSQLERKGLSAK